MYSRLIKVPNKRSFFLFGPRLAGKSTLLRQFFSEKDSLFIDLLRPAILQKYLGEPETLEREIEAQKSRYKRVILDEVQRAPALLDVVHHVMESPLGENLQFVMSGSSARKLKRARANLLGGRAWSLELFPLTHLELGKDFNLKKVLSLGSLPRIYAAKEGDALEDLRAYVETYLTEEIKAEALTRNLGAFVRFLPLAASESGRLINFSSISREIGVGYKTIQEYFQILEDTLLGFWLEPYGKSPRKRMAKHPKFYFFDTGAQRALKKTLRDPVEPRTPEFGSLFENFFINEVRRLNSYLRLDLGLSFYRTEAGAEVDLVVHRPGTSPLAIEIKATERPSTALCLGLLSFAEIEPKAELILACLIERPQIFHFGSRMVRALPWQDCLNILIVKTPGRRRRGFF